MASLIILKRRINAAQNVSKTTRAMQMIAASKLKKAQNAATSGKPYVEKLTIMAQNIASKLDGEECHEYIKGNTSTKSLLIVISPDKGLCGGLITNLTREFIRNSANNEDITYINVGKKLEGQIARLKKEVIASFVFGTITPTFDMVYPISRLTDEYYLSGKVGAVKILSTKFTSIFTQKPNLTTILPIEIPQTENASKQKDFYIFEPHVNAILPSLLKHYLEMTLYQHLLESFVSEQAARMIAMQNATTNAKEIIQELRLEYNKTRQARITSEILDITNTGTRE